MKTLKTAFVESFDHNAIADEPIDTYGLPVEDSFFRGQVPVVIKHIPRGRNGQLVSPGRNHGRSYALNIEAEISTEPWQDQYGNAYTTLVTKGNNFSRPEIMRSGTAPSGFMPYGLQEGDAILRVLRASRLMREAKIDTEWIVRVQEPKQLSFESEFVTPSEYKRRLIEKLLAGVALAQSGIEPVEDINEEDEHEEIASIAKALNGMDFFITLRAMATPDRVIDLANGRYVDLARLQRVLDIYNKISSYRQDDFKLLDLPTSLDLLTSPEYLDATVIKQYFSEVLPRLIGLNLARLHDNGLVHVFPTLGNVTALGGLVDLDSVRGPKLDLDDQSPGVDEMVRDLEYIAGDEHSAELSPLMQCIGTLLKVDPAQLIDSFRNNLMISYIDARERESSEPFRQKEILEIMASLADREGWEVAKNYVIGITYPYINELVRSQVSAVVKEPLRPTPDDLTTSLAYYYLHHDDDTEEIPSFFKDYHPTSEALKNKLRLYFAGGEDERQLVGEDIAKAVLEPLLEGLRFEQVHATFDEICVAITEQFKGTPYEGLDQEHIPFIMVMHANEAIDEAVNNFVLPDPEAFWEYMAKEFQNKLLEITSQVMALRSAKI